MASFESIEVAGELVDAGFSLWADKGRLRYVGPAEALTQTLRTRAIEAREVLLASLVREGCSLTPPSVAQRRIYAAHATSEADAAYVVPLAWHINGPFDVRRAYECLRVLAQRHEVLRQAFRRVQGHLVGVVMDRAELDCLSWSVWAPHDSEHEVMRAWLDAEAARPFNMARAPLWRVRMLHARDGSCHMLFALHHLICDEWSSARLISEFAQAYCGSDSIQPQNDLSQYRDYVSWQRAHSIRAEVAAKVDACAERWNRARACAGALPWRGDARHGDMGSAVAVRTLLPQVEHAVEQAARALGISEFVFMLSAFVMLLAYYSRGRGVTLVTPVTCRLDERFVDVMGPVQNLAAIAVTVEPHLDFSALCERIAAQVEEAFDADYPPIEEVMTKVAERAAGARSFLSDAMFTKITPCAPLALNGLSCEPVPLACAQAKTALLACFGRHEQLLHVSFEYRPALLESSVVEGMLHNYAVLIEHCTNDVSTCFQAVTDVLAQHKRMAFATPRKPRAFTVLDLFDEVVASQPHRLAITGHVHLSYASLDRLARLIHRLLPETALSVEARVVLWGSMSPQMIAAMLAVMRSGACIVPFDAETPVQRIANICSNDCIRLVVVCNEVLAERAAQIEEASDAFVVVLDEAAWQETPQADEERHPSLAPQSLAYVMYTSGSTGKPKGVGVSHQAFTSFIEWAVDTLDIRGMDAFNILTHASFDVSLFEIFAPLVAACPLHIGNGATYGDKARNAIRGGLAMVPSVMSTLLAAGDFPCCPTHLFVAGEAFPPALREQLAEHAPHACIWNLYGPTEAVVYASAQHLGENRRTSIGMPRHGVHCHVLRDDWTLLPDGAIGELAIGGLVAREYVGMPALTAARFVPDPFVETPGARMYLTGDLVRTNGACELEYIGRLDRQFKLLGVRVEPEEIERVLLEHPAVTAAVVSLQADGGILTAYVEAHDHPDLEHALRRHCYARLPRGMLPQQFIRLQALSRTATGKLDMAAHGVPSGKSVTQRSSASPTIKTPTQQALMRIWGTVLGHEAFNIHTNFFEAGGHSLALLAVHDRLAREFENALSVVDLFVYTTVAQLAERLEARPNKAMDDDQIGLRAGLYRKALRQHRIQHGNISAY